MSSETFAVIAIWNAIMLVAVSVIAIYLAMR